MPTPSTGVARILPILSWAPRYQRKWLRLDLVAGIAVAALVVPKSLGYAGIAEVPINVNHARRDEASRLDRAVQLVVREP